jgi:hypothetical protein
MSALVAVLTLVLLAAVIAVVSRPFFSSRAPGQAGDSLDSPPARTELEVEREAKYREIRDAELDYRTGKLSIEDYEAVDGALRAEAIEILDRLEATEQQEPDSASPK